MANGRFLKLIKELAAVKSQCLLCQAIKLVSLAQPVYLIW